ncbi:MAG: hypothetical protein ACJ8CR_21090 [Roseiflexaceae bacterium]
MAQPLSSDERRPTTDDRRRSRPPTTNDRRPTKKPPTRSPVHPFTTHGAAIRRSSAMTASVLSSGYSTALERMLQVGSSAHGHVDSLVLTHHRDRRAGAPPG